MEGGSISEGATVWVPCRNSVWSQASIVRKVSENEYEVRLLDTKENDKLKTVHVNEVAKLAGDSSIPICNSFDENGVDDMCTLNHLHEPAVLKNLQLRFFKNLPYSYTGQICIAVNPYQWLDLYSKDLYDRYLNSPKENLPPHPFALSSAAYNDMVRNDREQSILVSGESGAGKTETVKIMMDHLASISGGGSERSEIIDKVLKSNPLLESFGNAKTKRNDNSSRFGKFAQLQFSPSGRLVGSKCETYLLEKSRVVGQAKGERNYHIFYEIFCLLEDDKKLLHIHGNVEDYEFVKSGAFTEVDGTPDNQMLLKTREAMNVIGINIEEQISIFKVVASILNLGQIKYLSGSTEDETSVTNIECVKHVAELLQVDCDELSSTLCKRAMTAGAESYSIPLNSEQAEDLRDAFAKGIYAHMFDWLVRRINKSTRTRKTTKSHVGLLDIFGFESFEHNSFEQLCINYANEKLQQKFNGDVFKDVQEEYIAEEIPLELVTYEDNQAILDLIEGRMGIVNLLNEEVVRPTATDASFVSKVLDTHSSHGHLDGLKFNKMTFVIRHYAGEVTYDGTGFLEKNKDTLPTDIISLMRSSSSSLIRDIFVDQLDDTKNRNSTRGSTGRRHQGYLVGNTIAGAFRRQLVDLMENVSKTSVQYVRCIKPNTNKSSTEFDREMIADQLRYAGVIAAIRISRAAFPNRLTLDEFQNRFKIICPSRLKEASGEEMVVGLLAELLPSEDMQSTQNKKFALGKTKIYFSSGLLQRLEETRSDLLRSYAICLQRRIRGWVFRKQFITKRNSAVRLQSLIRKLMEEKKYKSLKQGIIALQSVVKCKLQMKVYKSVLEKERKRIVEGKLLAAERIEAEQGTSEQSKTDHMIPVAKPVEENPVVSGNGPVLEQAMLDALSSAGSKVAAAEAAAREAKAAADAAASLNKELRAENEQLKSKISSNIAEHADADLLKENQNLKAQILALQTQLLRAQEVSLISATVVDSRITYRDQKQFVEYKLQIETNTRGTLYVWHRYSTFRSLASTLQSKSGYKRKEIPELPSKQLFNNFSEKVIKERVDRLNQFLDAATKADNLQWGIRVDNETCVYKRRVKNSSQRDSTSDPPSRRPSKSRGFSFLRSSITSKE